MRLKMMLNGADIDQYHLTPLRGNLEKLITPAPEKKLITNENDSINGVMIVTTPDMARVDKRELLLQFKLNTYSITDLQRELDNLRTVLRNGVIDGGTPTGINELHVPILQKTYRLKFVNFDKYKNFGLDGKATIVIKFLEPDPTQQQM